MTKFLFSLVRQVALFLSVVVFSSVIVYGQTSPTTTDLHVWYSGDYFTTIPYSYVTHTVYSAMQNRVSVPPGTVDAMQVLSSSRNPTAYTSSSGLLNNKTALRFDVVGGVSDFLEILPGGSPTDNDFDDASSSAKSVFVVFNADNVSSSTPQVIFEQGGTVNGMNIYIQNSLLYFNVYSTIGTLKQSYVSASIVAGTTYQCSMVFNGTGGLIEVYINGKFIDSFSNPNLTILNSQNELNAIGAAYGDTRFASGTASGTGVNAFTGYIAEFLYYNKLLTRAKREQTENYLLSKYAITAPVNQYVNCTNALGDNALLWFKSNAGLTTSTVSGTTTVSWTDQIGHGLNASKTYSSGAPVPTPSVINTYPALNFAASSDGLKIPSTNLLNTAGNSYGDRSWYFVLQPSTNVTDRQVIYKEGNTSKSVNVYIQGGNLYAVIYNGTAASTCIAPLTSTGTPVFVSVVKKGTSFTLYLNGVSYSGASYAYPLDYTTSSSISLGSSDVNDAYFASGLTPANRIYLGYIAEVAIFDKAYNSIEEDIVHQALSFKYNILIPTASNKYRWYPAFNKSLGGIGNNSSTEYNRETCTGIFTIHEENQNDGLLALLAENSEVISSTNIWKGYNSNTEDAPLNVFRSKHAWRADVWNGNTAATVAKEIFYSLKQTDYPFTLAAHQKPVLIVDQDGDFRNGAKVYVLTASGLNYTADHIPTSAGDFISIGVLNNYEYAEVGSPVYINNVDAFGLADRGYNKSTLTSSAVVVDYPSAMKTGEYFLLAHNGAPLTFTNTTNVPAPAYMSGLQRFWKVNKYKEVGTVGLEFDPSLVSGYTSLAPGDDLVLLIDHTGTGTFGAASTIEALVYHYGKYRVFNETFDLRDGDVFTIALAHRPPVVKTKNTTFLFNESSGQITGAVSTLTTLVGEDITAYPTSLPCTRHTDKATLFFTFNTGDDYLFGTTPFNAQVIVRIKSRTIATGNPSTLIKECTLTVNQNNPEQLYAVDLTTYYNSYPYKEISVEVVSFTPPGPASAANTTIQQSLVLKGEIVQEERVVVPTTPGTLIKNQAVTFISTNKALKFDWDIEFCKPASYEFQLLRLFNTQTYGTTYPLDVDKKNMYDAELDWSQAMSLETAEKTITLTLAEGTGFYAWRVRPVGTFYEGGIANSFNWGKWSSADIPRLNASTATILAADPLTDFNGSVLYYDQFDDDKNFIYSRSFTEQGKIHEGISFANGLQQGVQTQSRIVSNGEKGQVVISESVQDFSGRTVIETLPTPDETVDGLGAGNNLLGYRSNHLNNNNSIPSGFNAFDFDKDENYNSVDPTVNGMINLYYTDLNTDVQIPDANNYPYSRVLHDNDGLNRPKEQGGVGTTHKIGGKTVKITYASSTEPELIRLFGDEAPKSNTVLKTITTDQNGISSVTYTDLSGKVIATCLIPGDQDENSNLWPVDFESYKIVEPLNNNSPVAGAVGVEAAKPFVFTQTTNVVVTIEVTPSHIQSHCGSYCATCSYLATIQVIDLTDPTNVLTNITKNITIGGGEATCPLTNGSPQTESITVTLPAGKYIIKKTIVVDQTAAATYASSITAKINTEIQNFITTHITSLITGTSPNVKALNDTISDYLTGVKMLPAGFTMTLERGDPTLLAYDPVTNSDLRDGDKVTIATTCCAVTIPIMFPNIDPCQSYIDGKTSPDYANFATELVDRFKAAYNISTALTITHPKLGTYTEFDLKALFVNMLKATDASSNHLYTCSQVWNCWNAQILKASIPAGSGATNTVNDDDVPSDYPAWVTPSKINDASDLSEHPIEQFLNCAGTHYKGYLKSASADLRQYAFEVFLYPRVPTGGQTICENIFCKHQPEDPEPTVCNPLSCDKDEIQVTATAPYYYTLWFDNTSGVPANLTEDEYNQLSGCVKAQQNETSGVMPPTTDELTAQMIKQKIELESQCVSACDAKRDLFLTKLRKLYDADGDGYYHNEENDSIPVEDLCCTADQLVDYCKDQCNLSLFRAKCTDPNEIRVVGLGTEEEMHNLVSILYGEFELQDAASTETGCGTGFRKAESCYNAVGIYHLNSGTDVNDEAHDGDSDYALTYNNTGSGYFASGRFTTSGTAAMKDAYTYASCSTDTDRGITNNVTVSAWVKLEHTTGYNEKIIVQKMDASGVSPRKGFKLYMVNKYLYFDVYDNGTLRSSGSSIYPIETTSSTADLLIPDQQWHFITGVCRDTIVEIWIDGELQNSTKLSSGTITSIASTAPLYIGATSGVGESFEGPIDEVYIYSCAMGKGAILQQYTDTKIANVVYTGEPNGSSNCAPTNNTVPSRLWDIGVSDMPVYMNKNVVTISETKYLAYGVQYTLSPYSYSDYVVIIDKDKKVRELKALGGSSSKITDVIRSQNGNFLIVGEKYVSTTVNTVYVVEINENGDILWQNSTSDLLPFLAPVSFSHQLMDHLKVRESGNSVYAVGRSATIKTDNYVVYKFTKGTSIKSSYTYTLPDSEKEHLYVVNSKTGLYVAIDGAYPPVYNGTIRTYLAKIELATMLIEWDRVLDKTPSIQGNIYLVNNENNLLINSVTTSDEVIGRVNTNSYLADLYLLNIKTSDGSIQSERAIGEIGYQVQITQYCNSRKVTNDKVAFSYYSIRTIGNIYESRLMVISNSGIQGEFKYSAATTSDPGSTFHTIIDFRLIRDGYVILASEMTYSVPRTTVLRLDNNLNTRWSKHLNLYPEYYFLNATFTSISYFTNNNSILLSGISLRTASEIYERKSVNNGNPDYWFLNLGYPVTCHPQPICIKWTKTPITPEDPVEEPEDPTQTTIIIKTILTAITTQLTNCVATNLTAILDEYKAQCNNSIIETAKVQYEVKSGHYTLYYYDRAGMLVKTVPPAGVEFLDVYDGSGNPIADVLARKVETNHRLITKYKYNSFGQLVEQFTPDGDTTKFVYNKLGMLRFSQNAQQAKLTDQFYSYTKYDELGRIIEVGKAFESDPFTKLNNPVLNTVFLDGSEAFGHTSYPAKGTSEETYTVYTTPAAHLNYLGQGQRYLRNRVSYTFTNSLKGEKAITCYSYDPHGNVEWLVQDVPGFARNTIGYEYDLISNKVLKAKFNEERTDQFFHRYQYDADNRITAAETSRDNYLWDSDARYTYFKHGPLRRSGIGEDKIQGLDYTYTIHGWLKGVNAPSLSISDDPGQDNQTGNAYTKDEYGFVLGYYQGDYIRTGSKLSSTITGNAYALNSNKPLYNGNITSWVSRINKEGTGSSPLLIDGNKLDVSGQTFEYDFLNRIYNSKFQTFGTAFAAASGNQFGTTYTYDGNGNIETLTRNASGAIPEIDNLTYSYNEISPNKITNNKLRRVTDSNTLAGGDDIKSQSNADNYTYDKIGNLIGDDSEKSKISWNVYGKVSEVKRSAPTASSKDELRFVYDATGNRIAKEVNSNPYTAGGAAQRLPEALTTTYYVRDASGNVMGIYERTNAVLSGNYYTATYRLKELPIYGSSRLGEWNQQDVDYVIGTKVFHKDDLDKIQLDFNFEDKKTEYKNWITSSAATDQFTISSSVYAIPKVSLHSITGTTSALTGDALVNIQAVAGTQGGDVSIAESDNGQVLFYTASFKQYWGKSDVLLLFDADGHLMRNSGGIKASGNSRSVIVKVPGKTQQYYLMTRGTDQKLYAHTIDLSLAGNGTTGSPKGDVAAKNALMDNATYGGNLIALENYATGNSYVYATQYQAPTVSTTLGKLSVVLFEISKAGPATIKKPQVQCSNVVSWKDIGESEMKFSPDHKKFLLYNHRHNKGWFGVQRSEVIVFNVAANYRLTSNYVVDSVHVAAGITLPKQSAEFSADSRFVYYGADRLTLTGSPAASKDLSRYDIRNKSNTLLFQGHNGNLRRGLTGKIYMDDTLTQALPAYYEDNTGLSIQALNAVPFTTAIATGYKLTGILTLQNQKIYGEVAQNTIYTRVVGRKVYEMTDHLGNVTVVVNDLKKESWSIDGLVSNTASVKTYNNYYAFGMLMPGRVFAPDDYRYGFNGKEKDGETGWQDYGMRMNNPALARFFSMDPITKKYPELTPYQFASNRPIDGIDLDGLEHYSTTDGVYMGKVGDNTKIRILNFESTNTAAVDVYKKFIGLASSPHPVGKKVNSVLMRNSSEAFKYNEENINSLFKKWGDEYRPQSRNEEYVMSVFMKTIATAEGNKLKVFIEGTSPGGEKNLINFDNSTLKIGGRTTIEHGEISLQGGNFSDFGWERGPTIHTHTNGGIIKNKFSVEYGQYSRWGGDVGGILELKSNLYMTPFNSKNIYKLDYNKVRPYYDISDKQMEKVVEDATSVIK